MTCERYWRDGILLVERGEDDPHRAGCEACTRAHASRLELIEALPLIGDGHTGDPDWQARVWQRIDGARGWGLGRWGWQLTAVLAAACVVALWIGRAGPRPEGRSPVFEVVAGSVAMRSSSAAVGDRLRVRVDAGSEVWIYRDGKLLMQCRAGQPTTGCTLDPDGVTAELVLAREGKYRAIAVKGPVAPPRGVLDEDEGELISAGASYRAHDVVAR